jgi:CheY-specific phosphatase CheX
METDVLSVLEQVFATLLEQPIRPLAAASPRERAEAEGLTATISANGAWEGGFVLNCDQEAARDLGGLFFRQEAAELTSAQVQDALAELVNVVGGNLKALFPGPSALGLPVVVEGGDYSVTLPKTREVVRVGFGVAAHSLTLAIVSRQPEASPPGRPCDLEGSPPRV